MLEPYDCYAPGAVGRDGLLSGSNCSLRPITDANHQVTRRIGA